MGVEPMQWINKLRVNFKDKVYHTYYSDKHRARMMDDASSYKPSSGALKHSA